MKLVTQWAAVMTMTGSQLRRIALQPRQLPFWFRRATCHGISFSRTGTPPTILSSSSEAAGPFLPHPVAFFNLNKNHKKVVFLAPLQFLPSWANLVRTLTTTGKSCEKSAIFRPEHFKRTFKDNSWISLTCQFVVPCYSLCKCPVPLDWPGLGICT